MVTLMECTCWCVRLRTRCGRATGRAVAAGTSARDQTRRFRCSACVDGAGQRRATRRDFRPAGKTRRAGLTKGPVLFTNGGTMSTPALLDLDYKTYSIAGALAIWEQRSHRAQHAVPPGWCARLLQIA